LTNPEEIKVICEGFDKNDEIFGSGLKIGGQKYFTIRADDRVIQGRKVLPAAQQRANASGRRRGCLC
jgi:Profilin